MAEQRIIRPAWERKFAEGKMFERMDCVRCGARFNFSQTPRVTRVPRCPVCGAFGAQPHAA